MHFSFRVSAYLLCYSHLYVVYTQDKCITLIVDRQYYNTFIIILYSMHTSQIGEIPVMEASFVN